MIEIAGQSRRGRERSKDAVLHPQIQASVAGITDNGRQLQEEERLTLVHHLPIHPVKSCVARPCTELSALLAGVGDQIESKAARSTKIDVFAGRTHLGPDGSRRGADSPNFRRGLRARFGHQCRTDLGLVSHSLPHVLRCTGEVPERFQRGSERLHRRGDPPDLVQHVLFAYSAPRVKQKLRHVCGSCSSNPFGLTHGHTSFLFLEPLLELQKWIMHKAYVQLKHLPHVLG